MLDRRNWLQRVGVTSLICAAANHKAFGLPFWGAGKEWAKRLGLVNAQLVKGSLSPLEWQLGVDAIYGECDFSQVLRTLDIEAVERQMKAPLQREVWKGVHVDGLGRNAQVKTKIVGIKAGRSIPPHGHENEVSCFLTIQGRFHLRQWERVKLGKDFMDLSPAFDGLSGEGAWNSQSEEHTNVHWLSSVGGDAYLLSVRVVNLHGKGPYRSRIPLDMQSAIPVSENLYRAPIMERDAWYRLYG